MFIVVLVITLVCAFLITGTLAFYNVNKYYRRCNKTYDALYEVHDENFSTKG